VIQYACDRCDGLLEVPGFLPVDQETGVAPGKTVRFSVWADIKAINEKGETFRPDLCNRCVAVLVERAATRHRNVAPSASSPPLVRETCDLAADRLSEVATTPPEGP
jgi:hypothetical protein